MPAKRSAGAALVLLAGLLARSAAAQQRSEPNLMLQLFGGLTGGSDLWEINRQQLIVRGTEAFPRYDSMRITRRLDPGLVLGASGMIFPQPSLGFSGEVVLLSLPFSDDCTMAFKSPTIDPLERNQQLCDNLGASGGTATSVAVSVGGIWRPFARAAVSPYLRGQMGLSIRNSSTVEVLSNYVDFDGTLSNPFVMILDPGRSLNTVTGALGGGMMIPFAQGYQVRLELRDNLVLLDRITGAASDVAVAPTERSLTHAFSFMVGLDVVLEQKRGRRY